MSYRGVRVKGFLRLLAIPHFFPRRKKWGKKDAPVKSRFPRRSARLRETQNSLRSNMLRFFFRKRLPARGFSTGEAPPPHPSLYTFLILRGNRETESKFRGRDGKDTQKTFFSWFLWDIFSCFTMAYVHAYQNFWGIARIFIPRPPQTLQQERNLWATCKIKLPGFTPEKHRAPAASTSPVSLHLHPRNPGDGGGYNPPR